MTEARNKSVKERRTKGNAIQTKHFKQEARISNQNISQIRINTTQIGCRTEPLNRTICASDRHAIWLRDKTATVD